VNAAHALNRTDAGAFGQRADDQCQFVCFQVACHIVTVFFTRLIVLQKVKKSTAIL
jgi:hypothetical protein